MIARVCTGLSVIVGRALIQENVELWLLFNAAADEGQNLVKAAQKQPAVHLDFIQRIVYRTSGRVGEALRRSGLQADAKSLLPLPPGPATSS